MSQPQLQFRVKTFEFEPSDPDGPKKAQDEANAFLASVMADESWTMQNITSSVLPVRKFSGFDSLMMVVQIQVANTQDLMQMAEQQHANQAEAQREVFARANLAGGGAIMLPAGVEPPEGAVLVDS